VLPWYYIEVHFELLESVLEFFLFTLIFKPAHPISYLAQNAMTPIWVRNILNVCEFIYALRILGRLIVLISMQDCSFK
jgi:hypothetical protein